MCTPHLFSLCESDDLLKPTITMCNQHKSIILISSDIEGNEGTTAITIKSWVSTGVSVQ